LLLEEKNYKKILEKIIQSNEIIRFVSICNQYGTTIDKLSRNGEPLLLTEFDTEKLARAGVDSWHYRKQLSSKIGKGQFAMVVYEKIIRITIPVDNNHYLLASIDNVVEIPKIIDIMIKIIEE